MNQKNYSVHIEGRGEEFVYADSEIKLQLQRTYCNGHRLYCNDTSGLFGPALLFGKRQAVIENLCDFFDTRHAPTIFVVDERDKDRQDLENLFADLASHGHKVTIEYDSAEKRERVRDDMHLSILKAGKGLSINGVKIHTIEDYWRWKRQSTPTCG